MRAFLDYFGVNSKWWQLTHRLARHGHLALAKCCQNLCWQGENVYALTTAHIEYATPRQTSGNLKAT